MDNGMSTFALNVNAFSRIKQHHFYALFIHDLTILIRSIAYSEIHDVTHWQHQILLVNEIIHTLSVRLEDLIIDEQSIHDNDMTQQIVNELVEKDDFIKLYVQRIIDTNLELYFKEEFL